MSFEIISKITDIETIAIEGGIREIRALRLRHGKGRWRKRKGVALVRLLTDNTIHQAELHWYEAEGVGKRDFKIKRLME